MGDVDSAITAYEKSLSLEIRFETLANLADMYERHNRLEAAFETAKQGLALQPDSSHLHLVMARCERRQKRYSQCINRLTSALTAPGSDNNRQLIHFELGKAYDFLKQSDEAYQHFCASGALQQQIWQKQNKEPYNFYQEMVTVTPKMTPAWLASWSPVTISDAFDDPIFLIGFPRSGTTLLDQILDSHSALQLMEEKPPLTVIKNLVNILPNHYPDALVTINTEQVHTFRQRYFAEVDRAIKREPEKKLIDKLPLNIVNIPLIYRLFPKAKFILAIRHPCDVCLSCFMQSFELNSAMSNFTSLEKTVDLYVIVMNLWNICQKIFPIPVHINRYEDLVNNFERETTKILNFLALDWEAQIKNYSEHAKQRHINTPSYSQASEPIYHHAQYRWYRYQKQLAPFLPVLQPFIERYGYLSVAQ
jgi:tetratricopeptide (TPR) repeat protein